MRGRLLVGLVAFHVWRFLRESTDRSSCQLRGVDSLWVESPGVPGQPGHHSSRQSRPVPTRFPPGGCPLYSSGGGSGAFEVFSSSRCPGRSPQPSPASCRDRVVSSPSGGEVTASRLGQSVDRPLCDKPQRETAPVLLACPGSLGRL